MLIFPAQILVIASIHQPSTTTFELFDKLLLLSRGKTVYNGRVDDVKDYFAALGFSLPLYMNPAEFVIDLVNTDFARDQNSASQRLLTLQDAWNNSNPALSKIGRASCRERVF